MFEYNSLHVSHHVSSEVIDPSIAKQPGLPCRCTRAYGPPDWPTIDESATGPKMCVAFDQYACGDGLYWTRCVVYGLVNCLPMEILLDRIK